VSDSRDSLARDGECEQVCSPRASSRESGMRPVVRMGPASERRNRSEGRRQQRADVSVSLAFQRDGQTLVRAVATNVSLGGAFIETLTPAAFGARIVVLLPLPGMHYPAAIPSVVRWVSAEGMGVQFGMMGARETHALMQLLGRLVP
jgi:hypothetical protein